MFASVSAAAAESDQLIQQAQRIAHAAVGSARQQAQRRRLELQGFRGCDEVQALADQFADSRFRLNCRQRDSTVTGSFCGSVVASRNLTCGGGSSSVFSSALKE